MEKYIHPALYKRQYTNLRLANLGLKQMYVNKRGPKYLETR